MKRRRHYKEKSSRALAEVMLDAVLWLARQVDKRLLRRKRK